MLANIQKVAGKDDKTMRKKMHTKKKEINKINVEKSKDRKEYKKYAEL